MQKIESDQQDTDRVMHTEYKIAREQKEQMNFDTEILYGKDRLQNLARETPFARKSG